MISIEFKKGPVRWKLHYFGDRPAITDCLTCAIFIQCNHTDDIPGFQKVPCYTRLIDLHLSEDRILGQCSKNTKYEIGRAARDGVETSLEQNPEKFVAFYNAFSATKHLRKLSSASMAPFKGHLILTKATLGEETLVMHSYLIDRSIQRARL